MGAIEKLRAISGQFQVILAKLYASPNYRVGKKLSSIGVPHEIGTFTLAIDDKRVFARLEIGSGGVESRTLQFYQLFCDSRGNQIVDCGWTALTLEELVAKVERALLPIIQGFDERKALIEMREREMRRLQWEIEQIVVGIDPATGQPLKIEPKGADVP